MWNRKLVECSGNFYPMPRDWNEAFEQLKHYLGTIAKKRVVIFIDEMPWLDTPKSKFVSAFEYFWNDWAFFAERTYGDHLRFGHNVDE